MWNLLFIAIAYLTVSFFFGSTNLVAQKKHQSKKLTSTAKKISSPSIDQQARQKSADFWWSKLTKCGNDFYTQGTSDPASSLLGGVLNKPKNIVFQLKNPSFTVEKDSISYADKLNGLEYRGTSSLTVKVSRTYSMVKIPYNSEGGWGQWQNGLPKYSYSNTWLSSQDFGISLWKKNGDWTIYTGTNKQAAFLGPINCSDIPN